MKTLHLSITVTLSLSVLFLIISQHAYAPCATGSNGIQTCAMGPIPVTLDIPTHVYVSGDMINITGRVDRDLLQNNEPLSISFHDSKRNIVRGPEMLSEINGTYSYHLKLVQSFGSTGQYDIQIGQGKMVDTGTWFMFIASPYKLQINGLNYSINYKITSGNLDKVSLNKTESSLTAYIADTMNGGYLTLELPRKIIDAKSSNGEDLQFVVLVGYTPNMVKANFTELYNNSNTRTLQISFPYDPTTNAIGDWYIQIIGTNQMKIENIETPLKQFKSGVAAKDIHCNNGLQLIFKTEDGSPACVRSDTAIHLEKIDWGVRVSSNSSRVQTSLHDMSDSSSSLRLYLSVTPDVIQSGESVGIKISVNNTLLHAINVTAQDNWSYENVSTGPCSTIGYGIAILEGYYTTESMTQGKNMPLYGANVLCPVMAKTAKVYQFQPQSDQVKEIVCNKIPGFTCYSGMSEMGQNYGFDGYWDWKSDKGQFFKPDKYTVIGADEWGHVAIQHFTVTNSTKR